MLAVNRLAQINLCNNLTKLLVNHRYPEVYTVDPPCTI